MKKILIFYASFGGGHLSAAKSIENYLAENYKDVDVEIIDCLKYASKTFEKISISTYLKMTKSAPWVWGKLYTNSEKKTLAHITTKTNSFLAIKLLKLLRQKKPDLIISAHPFSSQMCTYLKRKKKIHCEIATVLTDFNSHDQWLIGHEFTDYYFVSNTDMQRELISKGIEERKIIVTGIPIRKEFLIEHNKQEILNDLGFEEHKKTILFFGGGALGVGKKTTLNIFSCLVSNFSNLQIIAISGKNKSMKTAFDEIAKNSNNNNIKIFEFTDKVAEYMSIADVIITKPGGLTTSESLVSHLPMIIINPIPGQEEENAEFLENKKIAKWIRKDDDAKFILNIMLNDDTVLNNMRENTYTIAKPNATKNICEILMS